PGPEHAVWKTSVRLSAGESVSAAALETMNGANTPFLQVGIPFNPATEAPISSVRYRIAVNGAPDSTGALLPARRSAPGILYFELPLSAETVPALTSATSSPVTFTVTLTATDAAGNAATVPLLSPEPAIGGTFLFHVLGPPLFVEEDRTYPGRGDPQSIFPFSLAAGTYGSRFSGIPGTEPTRVARFIVSNPHAVEVPMIASVSGFRATGSEQW